MKRKVTNLPVETRPELMHDRAQFGASSMKEFREYRFDLRKSLEQIERSVLQVAIGRFQNQTKVAEFLGMTEQNLRYRMRLLGIKSLGRGKKPMKLSQAGKHETNMQVV